MPLNAATTRTTIRGRRIRATAAPPPGTPHSSTLPRCATSARPCASTDGVNVPPPGSAQIRLASAATRSRCVFTDTAAIADPLPSTE